jgi:hypothetical protein
MTVHVLLKGKAVVGFSRKMLATVIFFASGWLIVLSPAGHSPPVYGQAIILPHSSPDGLQSSSSSSSSASSLGIIPFSSTVPSSSSALLLPYLPVDHQVVSPWFPSLPAISCGAGIFSFTIEGTPDEGVHVSISDDKKDYHDDDRDNKLMALQIKMDNTNLGSISKDDDEISGEIFVGRKNIKTNQGDDFVVKNLFNNCRTLAFSSSADVNIKTPLPATPSTEATNVLTSQTGFHPRGTLSTCPIGYENNVRGVCVPRLY